MAIAFAIVALPFRLVFWLFRHPKVLVLIGIIVGIIFGLKACNAALPNNTKTPTVEIAKYQQIAPKPTVAPYVVATSSRIYYVTKYTDTKQILTLLEYFTYDKTQWVKSKQPLRIDRNVYGEVRIYANKT